MRPPISYRTPLTGSILFLVFFMGVSLLTEVSILAQKANEEYEVKAAFIYNFFKFVDWTNEPGGDMVFCVSGENPFSPAALDSMRAKPARGKKIVIREIENINTSNCAVIFISSSEEWHISKITREIKGLGVLTIGDTRGYAQKGVMINFFTEQNKVRFEINPEAAEKSGLKISSKLLSLATIVHEAP